MTVPSLYAIGPDKMDCKHCACDACKPICIPATLGGPRTTFQGRGVIWSDQHLRWLAEWQKLTEICDKLWISGKNPGWYLASLKSLPRLGGLCSDQGSIRIRTLPVPNGRDNSISPADWLIAVPEWLMDSACPVTCHRPGKWGWMSSLILNGAWPGMASP